MERGSMCQPLAILSMSLKHTCNVVDGSMKCRACAESVPYKWDSKADKQLANQLEFLTAKKPMKNFCDFCQCDDCRLGRSDLYHAPTVGEKWICDICFAYDMCTSDDNPGGAPRNPSGPCKDTNCIHRPKLIGGWTKEFVIREETVGGYTVHIQYESGVGCEIGSFIASVPELPGCMADGDSYYQAFENAQYAIKLWLEADARRKEKL